MGLSNLFDSTNASKIRKFLACVSLVIPAFILFLIVIYGLAIIDNGPDPGREIGLFLWGTWAIFCGVYLKNNKFKIAGAFMLIFSFLGLFSY
jgi:hypothetical protein